MQIRLALLSIVLTTSVALAGPTVLRDSVMQVTLPDGWQQRPYLSNANMLGASNFHGLGSSPADTFNFQCMHLAKQTLPTLPTLRSLADEMIKEQTKPLKDVSVQPMRSIQLSGHAALQTEISGTMPLKSMHLELTHLWAFTEDKTYYYCLHGWTSRPYFDTARPILKSIEDSWKIL